MPPPPLLLLLLLLLLPCQSFHSLAGNAGDLLVGGNKAFVCSSKRFHVSTNVCGAIRHAGLSFSNRKSVEKMRAPTCIHLRRLLPIACAQC